MTIDEAIKNNKEILSRGSMIDDPDDSASIKLGIEALKCIREHRAEFGNIPYTGLPGETS